MQEYRELAPIKGPEAFEERSREAAMSQAAMVLATGAGVRGHAETAAAAEELDLPPMTAIRHEGGMSVEQAVSQLDIDVATHVTQPELRIPGSTTAGLAKQLFDTPNADNAAALIEGNMHSSSPIVRAAAAAAALDTTGPREDVVERLVAASRHRDPLARDLGRVGLARVDPDHEALRRLVGRPAPLQGTDRTSHTAVVTHGTFASRSRWWRPGGSLYKYLNGLAPPLHMHGTSYQWTGRYSHGARDLDADRLVSWLDDQGLQTPDFFSHSHGGTVAHLATTKGAKFDRLVLMSWPVHSQWFPDWANVGRIIDIRVKWDLVIMADRGSQVFDAPAAHANQVETHVNGWFDHSATNDPSYWERYGLPAAL